MLVVAVHKISSTHVCNSFFSSICDNKLWIHFILLLLLTYSSKIRANKTLHVNKIICVEQRKAVSETLCYHYYYRERLWKRRERDEIYRDVRPLRKFLLKRIIIISLYCLTFYWRSTFSIFLRTQSWTMIEELCA